MTLERFPVPPKPSLPQEAPWREVEEIIQLLRAIIAALTGKPVVLPPPTIIIPTPPEKVEKPKEIEPVELAIAPDDLKPITDRLDIFNERLQVINYNIQKPIITRLDTVSYKLDVVASLIPTLPTLEPVTTRLDKITDKLDTLISLYRVPAPVPPVPIEIEPITSRLDTLIAPIANKPAFTTGQKKVDTAGEPVQLDDLLIPDGCKLTIIAKTGNSGYIYPGTRATARQSNRRFDGLSAGLAVSLKVNNANLVWIDASVSGDGVSYIAEQDK